VVAPMAGVVVDHRYTTGGDNGLLHKRVIARGGYAIVHEVLLLRNRHLTFSLRIFKQDKFALH
jgi:hypothetical protein